MALKQQLLQFKFSNFEDVSLNGITYADKHHADCKGNQIKVALEFKNHSDGDDSWLSFMLKYKSVVNDIVQASFIIRNSSGKVVHEDDSCIFQLRKGRTTGVANYEFIRRSKVTGNDSVLSNGALIFEVDLQYKPKQNACYRPPNELVENLLKLLENGQGADVTFKVQGEDILAHKLILEAGSPFLATFYEGILEGTAVEIEDISPKVFRLVLRYIYGDDSLNKDDVKELWQDIIVAADRYCLASLKMAVETIVIQECTVDTTNVADYILFADAKTCPLIKEYAMAYFIARAEDILDSPHSAKLQESAELLKELMVAVLRKHNNADGRGGPNNLTVDELRKELATEGLDADGSKEVLVWRLEEFKARSLNKRRRIE